MSATERECKAHLLAPEQLLHALHHQPLKPLHVHPHHIQLLFPLLQPHLPSMPCVILRAHMRFHVHHCFRVQRGAFRPAAKMISVLHLLQSCGRENLTPQDHHRCSRKCHR